MQMTGPLVSIGMSVRNSASSIAATMRSVLRQSFADWEMILIDDGSVDGTLHIVRGFDDQRIRVIADGQNRGLAVRLNQTIALAQGRYFARLDGDDVCFPERLERQVAYLESHPGVDLLATGGIVFDSGGRALGRRFAPLDHRAICAHPWSGFYFAHPSWMGRVEWFRRHGYSERAVKSQDYDLLLRTHRSSSFAALPDRLIGYREERLSLRKNLASRWHTMLAQARFARETGEWPRFMLGAGEQFTKACYELVVVSFGLERRMLGHRALPLDDTDLRVWNSLWRELVAEEDLPCAG